MKTLITAIQSRSMHLLPTILEMGGELHAAYHPSVPYNLKFKETVLTKHLSKRSGCIFLARLGTVPTGYVFGFFTNDCLPNGKVFKINELYIKSEYRRSGIGTHLIFKICAWARQNGAVEIHVHYGKNSRTLGAFWKSVGFTSLSIKAVQADEKKL